MAFRVGQVVYDASICDHEYATQRIECWHGPCRVSVVFRQGHGVLVENDHARVTRLGPELITTHDRRSDERKEQANGDPRR